LREYVDRRCLMVRSLPIRVPPHPGEGLDSYLEALAARHHAAWGDVLDAVGLDAGTSGGRELYSWLMVLPVDRARDLQTSCGVDCATVQSMTVADLIGSAGESHCTAAPMVPVCLSPPRSRFCPACLAETGGRWQLWWRLRWAFACPIHQCLLADTCPCCDRWQRIGPHPHGLVPTPARCSRKADNAYGRDLRRCGADLSAAPTRRYLRDSAVLQVQSTILGAYRSGCAAFGIYAPDPVSAAQLTADLSGLAARILRYAHTEDLTGLLPTDLLDSYRHCVANRPAHHPHGAAPVSGAAQTAVAAVVAMRVLTCSDPHAAGAQLHWLVSASRRRGLAVTASNIGWSRHISDALHSAQLCSLSPFLTPSDQLRYRSAAARPTAPDASTDRTRHVPAMLWPNAAFFFAAPAVGIEQLRTALSAAVCLVSARRTLPHVIASLGSATTAPAVSRVLQALRADHRWPAMLAALTGLADTLDSGTCPIDYTRRRALPFEEFLSDPQWSEICWDTATPTGRALRVRLVRCWMFERAIGSPVRDCCHALNSAEFRSKVKTLPLTLTPAAVARLDHAATEFLHHHNVHDEPLRWQPNPDLFSASGLRSPTGDLTTIRRLLDEGRSTLTAIAAQTGTPVEYLHHLIGECDPPLPHHPSAPASAVRTSGMPVMSRAELIDLYEGRQLGLQRIGQIYAVSRHTVTHLARRYGVALRRPGRPFHS
jgi:TniQ